VSVDANTLLAILAMMLATFACRGGGYWLFSRIAPTPALRSMLAYIPGTLFVSYVVPAVVAGGPKEWLGTVATIAAVRITRSHTWPIFVGVGVAWLVWLLQPG
jgi:uncharacterized membrane protein